MEECKLPLLLLLLLLSAACGGWTCEQQHPDLSCYNDYDQTLTCEWNSSVQLGAATCEVLAKLIPSGFRSRVINKYKASCILEPISISTPGLRRCSMKFWKSSIFMDFQKWSVSLNCTSVQMTYQPVCHIQLSPPEAPKVNFTTVSWWPRGNPNARLSGYKSQMQWREEHQPWISHHDLDSKWKFDAELDENLLIRGRRYEARVRLKPSKEAGTWSTWSPVASWESTIGKSPPIKIEENLQGLIIAGTVTFAVVLTIVLLKTDRNTWADVAKKIRGPPLPNPEKPFKTWLLKTPYFSRESFDYFLKPEEILPVDVCGVDKVEPFGPEVAALLLEGARGNGDGETSKSSFSNPSYSQLCPPSPPTPPVAALTPGNLAPCAADTPYGPVRAHGEEGGGRSQEIQQLLSKGQNGGGGGLQVVSDYEKVEQVRPGRLQSLDSGVCSGEEVSQESLEPDSIGEGAEPAGSPPHLHGLFEKIRGGGAVGRGCLQVVSDYERVEPPPSPELPSLDSEAGSQEESLEGRSFLMLPPPPLSALLLGQRSLEPSTGGYMPKKC